MHTNENQYKGLFQILQFQLPFLTSTCRTQLIYFFFGSVKAFWLSVSDFLRFARYSSNSSTDISFKLGFDTLFFGTFGLFTLLLEPFDTVSVSTALVFFDSPILEDDGVSIPGFDLSSLEALFISTFFPRNDIIAGAEASDGMDVCVEVFRSSFF